MARVDDLSRSRVPLDQDSTLICVVELSRSSWLVAGMIPGVERRPLKKLEPDAPTLMRVIEGWRTEAIKANRAIGRVVIAYEAGAGWVLASTVVTVARCGSARDPLYQCRGFS